MISVGIDVSKGKSTVCILKPGGEVLETPFEMLHRMEGILSLVKLIKACGEEVRVVLEDTGHYHWPVVTLLVENGIFVCCVNALRMNKYCAQSIRRVKTDRIDSIRSTMQNGVLSIREFFLLGNPFLKKSNAPRLSTPKEKF